MAIEAVIFDASDVLYNRSGTDEKMLKFIRDLSQKFKIGMITNLYSSALEHHFSADQLGLFVYIHTFRKYGLSKPDPKVFEHTAERMAVLASNCVYVDDMSDNLRGAQVAGMKTVLFDGYESFRRQLQQILDQGK
jgi:putative hydrolase of the HAD superfamily